MSIAKLLFLILGMCFVLTSSPVEAAAARTWRTSYLQLEQTVDSAQSDEPPQEARIDTTSDGSDTSNAAHTVWKCSAKAQVSSMSQRAGIDLSANKPTSSLMLKLQHDIGVYASVEGVERLSSPLLYQQTTLRAGYVYSASDEWDLSADVSLFRYPSDTLNALAGSTAALSLSADYSGDMVDCSTSLDHYFGNPASTFLSVDVSHTFVFGEQQDFSLSPDLQVCVGADKYHIKKLNLTKTLRGLNSVSIDCYANYRLGSGFSIGADPMLLFSFQKDLLKVIKGDANATTRATQFLIVCTLMYRYSF